MSHNLYIKAGGTWHVPPAINVKVSGTWHPVQHVWRKVSGTWVHFWPHIPPGSWSRTTAGTYSFVVPSGITSIKVSVIGGGGGAGSCNNYGDFWVGSGGGAGGANMNQIVAVTPGETLTAVVAHKGYGASFNAGGSIVVNYDYNGNPVPYGTGTAGQTSVLKRSATNLVVATGGQPGCQFCAGGAGGSPGGGAGCQGSSPSYLGYGWVGTVCGGTNGTPYGNGGADVGITPGQNGQDGAILISWTGY